MVLTAATLHHYLLDRGLASSETLVDGDYRVLTASRRNAAFRVIFRSRPGYVVKQVGDWRSTHVRTFEAEAHWYWLARNHADFAPMRRFLSTCSGYDADNQVLILDVPERCEDLDRYHRRTGTFPVEMAQLTGETLAAFHAAVPDGARAGLSQDFRRAEPWVLSWHRMLEEALDNPSKGAVELLEIVKGDSQFEHGFEELRSRWRRETFINGDMKFAHCVKNGEALYFIDWEMADFGDPLWDVGAILQEYLSAWLRSLPARPGVPLSELVGKARHPLEQLQPAIRAFWQSYRGQAPGDNQEMLDRAVGYAAAWLIQCAYQSLRDAERIHIRAILMAQLARNILASRTDAVRGLLGC
ncbi:MAG: phosphotransferase [Candidatus Solibacter sp.]